MGLAPILRHLRSSIWFRPQKRMIRVLPCLEDRLKTTRAEHSGQLGAGLRGSRDP